jgi:beta-lactamase superfamily II metal-dependent hydrolase
MNANADLLQGECRAVALLWLAACVTLVSQVAASDVAQTGHSQESDPSVVKVGESLPPWSQGELDIHHISTGRGDALLFLFPDGTSLLKDASGKTEERAPFSLPTRPDASRPPGEWVARYVQRVLPAGAAGLDYALISHFHGDHMGAIVAESPTTRLGGGYRLSGITEVAEHVPIATLIDRGWPDYAFPAPVRNATVDNYRAFLDWQVRHRGLRVERFAPGRGDQIRLLRDQAAYPTFEVRNLYTNGVLWTGQGDDTRPLFPPDATDRPHAIPGENKLSTALRVRYGAFDYFSAGDLSSIDEEMAFQPPAWLDVEPAVARVSGPVDVMKANHHGSWDANSVPALAALQPRVIVVTTRADGHPAVNTYRRMTSERVWPGPRDIFITGLSAATLATTYGVERTAGAQGHVVVRVDPGGAAYRVYMLDDSDERMRVKTVSGPYRSR